MRVQKIDISRLKYESVADHCRADVCLHLYDNAGKHFGHVHLSCCANDVANTDHEAIKSKLLGDARRQMKWVPQASDADVPLEFAQDLAISLEH